MPNFRMNRTMNDADAISQTHRVERLPHLARLRKDQTKLAKFSPLFVLSVLFVALHFALSANAQTRPSIVWEQIETPHFLVIYDSKHRDLGVLYAEQAEHAFRAVSPTFGLWPERTVVLVDDGTDLANGSANGIPYSMIKSNPVLPSSLDSIGDYGNWGFELLAHEYTHILTFEPATGIMRPLRWVFGSLIRPNMLLPNWYLEGLAVEMETRHSSFGRLRSPNYLAIPRAMVEEGTLDVEDISRVNELGIPGWPGGIRPYLMGALLWNEISRKGGDKLIGDINLAYSRRIPYLIDGALEDALGVSYSTLLNQVYERATKNAKAQIDTVHKASLFSGTKLDQVGQFNHTPAISPDGSKLLFVAREHNNDGMVMLADRGSQAVSFSTVPSKRIAFADFVNRVGWFPDSRHFVYDMISTFDRFEHFSDLWVGDVTPGTRPTQITKGLRAREPSVSPDGKSIVFVQVVAGSTHLSLVSADGSNAREIYNPPIQTRLSHPLFLSDNTILFAEKRDDGNEVFKVYALPGGNSTPAAEPQTVLREFSPVHFPKLTPEGLLFVSDRSGIANLYLAAKDLKSARAVSNTTTRLMTGEIDSRTGDLLYSRLDSAGQLVYLTKREVWSQTPAQLPQVSSLVDSEWPAQGDLSGNPEKLINKTSFEPEDYDPFSLLWPRYWMPYGFLIPDGLFMQASTANSDPTGRHSYSLSASFDTLTNKPSFFGQYTNRITRVPISLVAEDLNEYIYSGGLVRRTTSGALSGRFFLPGLSNDWRGGLALESLQTQVPLATGTDLIVRGGVQVSLGYSNVSRRGFEISPEHGGSFAVAHTRYLPTLGNIDYELTEITAATYFSKWLPDRHALMLSVTASLAPRLNRVILGRTTVGGTYQTGLTQTGLLMRGYGSGVFLGRNLISGTAEYRFPIWYTYRGLSTTPFFLQRLHGDVFVDALTLDGLSYNSVARGYQYEQLGKYFVGSGLEIKADTTIFYHAAVQFIFGLYFGSDNRANPNGLFPFLGIGL